MAAQSGADRNMVRCSDLPANKTNERDRRILLRGIRMQCGATGLPPGKPAKIAAVRLALSGCG